MGKGFNSILAAGIMLGAATPVMAEELPFQPQYPFETAIIEYEGTGAMGGTSTLYIDAASNRQTTREHKEVSIMGMVQKENTLRISRPDGVYVINLDTKTGWRSENPNAVLAREWENMSPVEQQNVRANAKEFGFNLAASMGGKISPKSGNVLGKTCDLAQVMGTTSCTWSDVGVTLSTEVNMGIPSSQKAVAIKEDVALPEGIFEIPAGVQVKDSPMADTASAAARNLLHAMAKPEFDGNMNALMPAAGPSNLNLPKEMLDPANQKNMQQMMQKANEAMQQMQKMGVQK